MQKIYLLLLFLMPAAVFCQQAGNSPAKPMHHLLIGTGGSLQTVKDVSVSPNVYSGPVATFAIGHEGWRENKYGAFLLNAGFGDVKYKRAGVQHQSVFNLQADGLKRYELRKGRATRLFLGGQFTFLAAARLPTDAENNAVTYDGLLSLGVSGMAYRQFTLFKRRWQLRYELNLPFFDYLIRPSYTGAEPEKYLQDGVFNTNGNIKPWTVLKSGSFVTFNRFFMLDSQLSLTYPLRKNANALRLSYGWEYYTTSIHYKPMALGSQSLQFALLIHL